MLTNAPTVKLPDLARDLANRVSCRQAKVAVIGLGYVGLPLAMATARAGFCTTGFDIDEAKPQQLNAGKSYIGAVTSDDLLGQVREGRFSATSRFDSLGDADIVVICVPTPLTRHREPDLSFVTETTRTIAGSLRKGQLVILESTTYPGTTIEVVKPLLEIVGLKSGKDFWLGFSPEREDPGNAHFGTTSIPKVVAGDGADASFLIKAFYEAVVDQVVPVSSPSVAEAVKITENVFRSVNIALVNELKVIFDAMGIDVWEVIDAAATKPFGYMPFYPGPGLGGHCIPIDPFYLTWKSREFDLTTRFIELAGEINVSMPRYVISRLERALDEQQCVSLGSAHVLIIGLAYKKNISDIRESPSLTLIEVLQARGTVVDYHDPHVDEIGPTRQHPALAGCRSSGLTEGLLQNYNAVLIATDHDCVDYELIARHARMVVDTRNAMARRHLSCSCLVKA